jgi:DNA-binding Lrp family transcriptional regulator
MDEKNKQLLELLTANARESTSSLARKLQLSRTAVQERISKLEKQGVIAGYTVKLNKEYEKRLIKTWVVMATRQKLTPQVVTALRRIEQVKSLRTISGIYDLIATIQAEDTNPIDRVLDQIGAVEGVEKTLSSIELSIKFDR